jgi:hypothetical protein
MELELTGSMGLLERIQKFAAEELAKSCLWKEEAGVARWHPTRVIMRQAAGWHDTVYVRVMLQFLIPGVQEAEKTYLSTEMLRVGGNLDQGLSAAAEQQAVNQWFVLQGQGRQLVGEGKDNMSVGRWEQFGSPCGQPTIARLALALGAVPIATGVIGDGSMAAGGALVQMAAQRDGTASLDGNQDLQV